MKSMFNTSSAVMVLLLLTPIDSQAWGYRGHHVICSIASRLVQTKGLDAFMRLRCENLGYLCNVPDVIWKAQGEDQNRVGSPTHYVNPEKFGFTLSTMPTSVEEVFLKASNRDPSQERKRFFSEVGTLWFRGNQFFERAVSSLNTGAKSKAPSSKSEEQDASLDYNKGIYEFFLNLGFMGHFVGDASMPYHATVDYDGRQTGHDGIHAYYEEALVAELNSDDMNTIEKKAAKLTHRLPRNPSGDLDVVGTLKWLTIQVQSDRKAIESKDRYIDSNEKVRGAPRRNLHLFRKLIIKQLALSAYVQARLIEAAHKKSEAPIDFSKYRSYRFDAAPTFVSPDYF